MAKDITTISIIGSGYLGLTTASVLASSGFKVFAVDINEDVVNTINSGKSHFYEPGLDELVENTTQNGNLKATLDYSEAITNSDISFICVDTPTSDDGNLSTKACEAASKSIAKNLKEDHIVVMKSTVPVGTADKIINLIRENTNKNFHYASNPEFLSEGVGVMGTLLPDHIVIGASDNEVYQKIYDVWEKVDQFAKNEYLSNMEITDSVAKTYRSKFNYRKEFVERVVRVSIPSAELIKMAANSYLAMKISFANAMANITDKTGASINEVMTGIGADPRIGRDFLYAGIGWGGGCFPKDVKGLIKNAENLGYDFGLLKEVENINYNQINFTIEKIEEIFDGNIEDKTITVLGVSFKPGTSDIRVSPSIKLIEKISSKAKIVKVFDPEGLPNAKIALKRYNNIEFSDSLELSTRESDLVVLATDWPEFIDIDFENLKKRMKTPNLLDGRNKWPKERLVKLGFNYKGIGL